MRLTSPAFAEGEDIPSRHSCDGANHSPPLAWSDAPDGTRGFAIVCLDPDAPVGTWYHWAAFDIPPGADHLGQHCAPDAAGLHQGINDFGRRGYGGPCPPRGRGAHHYRFTLYALDVARLDLPSNPRCRDVEHAARTHAIASATLTGLYER